MLRRFLIPVFLFVILVAPRALSAGVPGDVLKAVESAYPPAIWHYGIQSAYEQPDASKLRGYAVVERGGIPAQRATFFISWQDYDYRGVVVHLDKEEKISTRRGGTYTYLQRGDVMAVAGIKVFNTTIYLDLLSADVYVPEEKSEAKRHSRVSVSLGFKFSREQLAEGPDAIVRRMSEWVKPFDNVDTARTYAQGIGGGRRAETTAAATPVVEKAAASGKGGTSGKTGSVEKAGAAETTPAAGDERMKTLEEKIEDAKRQLDEAEKELDQIKGSGQKKK